MAGNGKAPVWNAIQHLKAERDQADRMSNYIDTALVNLELLHAFISERATSSNGGARVEQAVDLQRWMTTQQAARKLGVTRAFVGRLLRNDVLTGEKVAGHGMGGLVWRIAADSVEELVEARA